MIVLDGGCDDGAARVYKIVAFRFYTASFTGADSLTTAAAVGLSRWRASGGSRRWGSARWRRHGVPLGCRWASRSTTSTSRGSAHLGGVVAGLVCSRAIAARNGAPPSVGGRRAVGGGASAWVRHRRDHDCVAIALRQAGHRWRTACLALGCTSVTPLATCRASCALAVEPALSVSSGDRAAMSEVQGVGSEVQCCLQAVECLIRVVVEWGIGGPVLQQA